MKFEIRRAFEQLLVAVTAVLALQGCRGEDILAPTEGAVLVRMGDNFFRPETVTVAVGGSVRWTNEGTANHTVVSDAQLWQSNPLPRAFWFEVRFDEPGTFDYHCSLHEGQRGTVIVE